MTRISRWTTWAILGLVVTILAMIFDYLPAERSLAGAFANLPPMGLWDLFNAIVGSTWLLGVFVAVTTLILYVIFLPRESIIPLAGIMGGVLINWILAPFVGRQHPGIGFDEAAFPASGTVLWATWIGSIIVVSVRRMRSGIIRTVVISLFAFVIVLGGVAQLSTGSYVLTDVLGGWIWSVAWVLWLHQTTRSVV